MTRPDIQEKSKLSIYFEIISILLKQGDIKIGRELDITQPGKVTLFTFRCKTEEKILKPQDMKVLYLNFEEIYNLYVRSCGGEKDTLSQHLLCAYLESNAAYIGLCKSYRFKWIENKIENSRITSAYMFDFDLLKKLMSVDFNIMHSIREFETRLLAMQVDIENISLKDRMVTQVTGYKNNLGYKWDESGECRRQDKDKTRTPEFDLKF